MAVGVLFMLTLTAFVSETGVKESRFMLGITTVFIIAPFVASSLSILFLDMDFLNERSRERAFREAKRRMTGWGFIFFGVYLAAIIFIPIVLGGEPLLAPTPQQECVMSPEKFNVSADPWKCSMFSPGSLAEECAKNPEYLKMTRLDCAELIPPSSYNQ